jgi:hypothetical protein
MAQGDALTNITSVTNASSFVIQASSGQEWVIHNLYHTKDCALLWTNGTLIGTMSILNGFNNETNLQIHVTNSTYLAIHSNSSQIVGYDGMVTK